MAFSIAGLFGSGIANAAGSAATAASSSGSWTSSLLNGAKGYFSSGQGWGALLSGIGAAAGSSSDKKKDATDAKYALELVKEQGNQALRKSAFEQQLVDYGKALDTNKKRVAIDSYGQFSKLQQRSPNYVPKPIAAAPVMPDYKTY